MCIWQGNQTNQRWCWHLNKKQTQRASGFMFTKGHVCLQITWWHYQTWPGVNSGQLFQLNGLWSGQTWICVCHLPARLDKYKIPGLDASCSLQSPAITPYFPSAARTTIQVWILGSSLNPDLSSGYQNQFNKHLCLFRRVVTGGGNSQSKQTPKLFEASRMEYYHQLHSSGGTQLPTANVKHLCKRLHFPPDLLYNTGQKFHRINKYPWWLFRIWFEIYFSNLVMLQ